jgi:hypothetical protein
MGLVGFKTLLFLVPSPSFLDPARRLVDVGRYVLPSAS